MSGGARPRRPDGPVGIALLGTGDIAVRQFVPAIRDTDGAHLVAVLSRDLERAKVVAARAGAPEAYDDLGDLLASPNVHAVVVATPDALHEPQVIEAARAGVHVLCEKPLTTTVDGCCRMMHAVSEAGITFALGYTFRYLQALRGVREIVRSGTLGRIRLLRGIWSWQSTPVEDAWCTDPELARYWALGRIGTHLIDVCRWYLGEEPVDVRGALLSPRDGGATDELSTVTLTFPDGVLAVLTVSVLFPGANRLEVYGEHGSLAAQDIFRHAPGPYTVDVGGEPVRFEWNNAFQDEVADFVRAIRTGAPPFVGIEDGLRNVAIMERVWIDSRSDPASRRPAGQERSQH